MIKVKAKKPVFYNKWRNPGEEFECDEKHAREYEKVGKVKILISNTVIKKESKITV